MQLGAVGLYDEEKLVGILNGRPIPKEALENKDSVSLEIAMFLLFITELNRGAMH